MIKIKAQPLPIPTEDKEQIAVVQYLQAKGLLFTHPANGAHKSPAARVLFKKLGQSAGCPDLLIFNQCSPWSGLAIEMKRQKGGSVSPEQKEWHSKLRSCGWRVEVCRGATDAITLIESINWRKV